VFVDIYTPPGVRAALDERRRILRHGFSVLLTIEDDIGNWNGIQQALSPLAIRFERRPHGLQALADVGPVRHRGGHDLSGFRSFFQPTESVIE